MILSDNYRYIDDQALDTHDESLVVRFDILKAFDSVWHRGLLHKFNAMVSSPEKFMDWFSLSHQNAK